MVSQEYILLCAFQLCSLLTWLFSAGSWEEAWLEYYSFGSFLLYSQHFLSCLPTLLSQSYVPQPFQEPRHSLAILRQSANHQLGTNFNRHLFSRSTHLCSFYFKYYLFVGQGLKRLSYLVQPCNNLHMNPSNHF